MAAQPTLSGIWDLCRRELILSLIKWFAGVKLFAGVLLNMCIGRAWLGHCSIHSKASEDWETGALHLLLLTFRHLTAPLPPPWADRDGSLAAVRESFSKARHSTNIQSRCKSPSRSYVFKKHELFRFPYIPSNQPTRLAGYLTQLCLGCLHDSHTRTLQKCGSNRVQCFVWCRGIGKTPRVFVISYAG